MATLNRASSIAPGSRWAVAAAVFAFSGMWLAACGGGSSNPAAPPAAQTRITGTVASGAAIAGAIVTVKDSDPATADVTGTAAADGTYSLDVSSLRPPLLVAAVGTLNGEPVTVVSVVPSLAVGATNTANVTSLTNAVAALVAPGGDLNALTSAAALGAVNSTTVADASALVVNALKTDPEFAVLLGSSFDPLTTPFSANGTGADAVLDLIDVSVTATGVAITNLAAPATESGGQPPPVILTQAQVSNPTAPPTLPPSAPVSELPTAEQMKAIADQFTACLALPIDQRVTLDANKQVTAVSAACDFAPPTWRSTGANWRDRIGMSLLRYSAFTGSVAGTPRIAAVLPAPNDTGTTFQHPYCNTQTCVIMTIPFTSASGKPWISNWMLGKINGEWSLVGNQLPYALSVAHLLFRYEGVNSAGANANPSDPNYYFFQNRFESVLNLNFDPLNSGALAAENIRAVVWKGPGLPASGVVSHRSQRCDTATRFPITNQEGILTVNNGTARQFWNNGGTRSFILDAAKLDGTALAMPAPSSSWATNPSPVNQNFRSAPLADPVPAWSLYTAEIYYFTNTGTTPDEVIKLRNETPYEPAATGATRNWPTLSAGFIDQYLTPNGAGAGSITDLAPTMSWTNPSDGYVNFGYLFAQNRVQATNSQGETATYYQRGQISFRPSAFGDTSAAGYEWAVLGNEAGTALSSFTSTIGTNPNPRCGVNELVPLEANATTASYREAGIQTVGPDRKLYLQIYFWQN